MNNRLIKSNNAGGGGCTDIVDNYDPFGGNGVALYQLNGNANDSSPNAYNGTFTTPAYGTGVFGQAGVFNGSSSNIRIDSLAASISNNQPLTVSGWFNAAALDDYCIIELGEYVSGTFRIFWSPLGKVNCQLGTSSSSATSIPSVNTFSINTWNQFVLSFNGTSVSLYVNGNFEAQENCSYDIDTNRGYIGTSQYQNQSPVYYFNGSIDQVRIFNTALDPLEVEALYTEELCICDGTVDTLDVLGDGSCIATYQLDGNANDLSGNYNGVQTDVTYPVGEFDLAASFNGSSSVVSTNLDLDNFDEEWSISMWVKFTFNTNNRMLATSTDNVDAFNGFVLDIGASGELRWRLRNSSGSVSAVSTTGTYGDNQWHNVVIVKSNTTNYIYVNGGAESNSTPTTNGINHSTGIVYGNSRSTYYNGSIDQVRIFNKALSAGEVTTLYNETPCN